MLAWLVATAFSRGSAADGCQPAQHVLYPALSTPPPVSRQADYVAEESWRTCSNACKERPFGTLGTAMLDDQSLFTRSDGIGRLWAISTSLIDNPHP
jgi:hypothetical protein